MSRLAGSWLALALATVLFGCSKEGSADGSAEGTSGGERVAVTVPATALEMMPSGMQLLVHVDANAMRSSGIMGILVNEAREQDDVDEAALAAIDYFAAQSDELLCGIGYETAGGSPPFACILSGRFSGWGIIAELAGMEDTTSRDPHGFAVLDSGNAEENDPALLVLDERHILAADLGTVDAVVGAMQEPGARASAQPGYEAIATTVGFGRHPLSVLGLLPDSLREEIAGAAATDQTAAVLAQVAGQLHAVTASLDIAQNTLLTVALHATTAESAADLSSLVRLMVQVGARSAEDAEVRDLLSNLEVAVEATRVQLTWSLPTTEFLDWLAGVADKATAETGTAAAAVVGP